MLEKFLNEKVQIIYTAYSDNYFNLKGIITKIDDNFIEVDSNQIISIKYIISIKSL